MPDKEFTQWLDCGYIFAWRDIVAGKTTSFRVVFLSEVAGKLPCPTMTYNQAFDYAIRDIDQNAENYLADFLAH